MIFDELISLKESGDDLLDRFSISEIRNWIKFDNYIPMPIITSHAFDTSDDVAVKFPNKHVIGKIKFLKDKPSREIRSYTNEELICFFIDHVDSVISKTEYIFKHDYLLIEDKFLKNYLKQYKSSSSFWGSYIHIDDLPPNPVFNESFKTTSLITEQNIKVDNSYYKDVLYLAINEPNPFNRFLKLYHTLEFQFDLHTAKKISDLLEEEGKEEEISFHLKSYAREDLKRLESLLTDGLTDLTSICDCLNRISSFLPQAEKIFYDYGKQSNPLKMFSDLKDMLAQKKFSKEGISSLPQNRQYEKFIPKICAYWIYRVRSSIAHNKYGEYLMDRVNDEKFIVQFAEPLLKEVVKQCFIK